MTGDELEERRRPFGNEEDIVKVIEKALVAAVCSWQTRAKDFTTAIDLRAQRARDSRTRKDIRV